MENIRVRKIVLALRHLFYISARQVKYVRYVGWLKFPYLGYPT
jgi:hypothetical protein